MLDAQADNESIVECEGILPSQFYHRASDFTPEQRLWLEVLKNGVECWQRVGSPILPSHYTGSIERCRYESRQRAHIEADNWIFGDFEPRYGFDFTQLCEALDVEPDFVRARLVRWAIQHQFIPYHEALKRSSHFAFSEGSNLPLPKAHRRSVRPGPRRITVGA